MMLLIDLLTNGLQCPLKVQALFPGALHTWVQRCFLRTFGRYHQALRMISTTNGFSLVQQILRSKDNLFALLNDHFDKGGEGEFPKLLFQFSSDRCVQPYMHMVQYKSSPTTDIVEKFCLWQIWGINQNSSVDLTTLFSYADTRRS